MKMKIVDYLFKASFAVLLIIFMVTGCKETGDLTIDPVEYDTVFTFTPSHGYPGNTVVISGTGLDAVTQVGFGSVAGDITAQSASSMSVTIPVGAQTAKIKLVVGSNVITSRKNFIVDATPVPTVIEFSPAIAGSGDVITITGNLLDKVDSVFIGTLKAAITGTPTASSMQVTAPVGLKTGKIRLFYTYMTDYGMLKPAESDSEVELNLALPVINSITPNITTLNIGDLVTIKGTMMSEVTKVEFGTINATPFTASGDSMLTCNVPTGATTGTIKLTLLDGDVQSGTFQINLPAITSFLPIKGAEAASSSTRALVIDGTKLDLVNSILVGTTTATIQTTTATKLIFTIPGNVAGVISLVATNGTVKSATPFFFTGDMWVNDWNTVFAVDRYDKLANNGFGSFTADETTYGYAYLTLGGGGAVHHKSFYLWGPAAGNDKFSLYTPDPNGVYLEFDMNVITIADSLKQTDGTLKFKIFMMDALGWGASGAYSYGYNGPKSYVLADGAWHHFRMHLKDFKASDNSGLYTTDVISNKPGAYCHPNSLRIATFVFGTPNVSGKGNIVLGLDNVKFVIEE
jgi:hypothetical protein